MAVGTIAVIITGMQLYLQRALAPSKTVVEVGQVNGQVTEPLLEYLEDKDMEQREASFSRVPHQRNGQCHCPTGMRSLTFWRKGSEPHEESRVHFISTTALQLSAAKWVEMAACSGARLAGQPRPDIPVYALAVSLAHEVIGDNLFSFLCPHIRERHVFTRSFCPTLRGCREAGTESQAPPFRLDHLSGRSCQGPEEHY